MSSPKKMITTYTKSLFQNVKGKVTVSERISTSELYVTFADVFIVGEELLLLRASLISSETLNSFFKNPTYSEKQKLKILLSIFPGLSVTMKAFLKVLTERGHLSYIPEISDEYNKFLATFKHSTKIKLITASPLKERFGKTLLSSLKTVTNSTEIILSIAYNPKLLGGLIIEYNSVAIDASILKEFSLFFSDI